MSAAHILVVDDEPNIRDVVGEILEDEGYEVATAQDGSSAREALRVRRPDLILLDIWMPDIDGITLLKEWGEVEPLPCPVIIMSGHGNVETAVEATRLGAYDFIEKPLSLAKLLLTVERALEADKLQQQYQGLKRASQHLAEPIGRSPVMQRLREQVLRIAQHDSWVLISGEAGTGKETVARFLHLNSQRRDGPFVDLGGGTVAGENAARELFGSEEQGRVHYGYLEKAQAGVLFLDDVADLDTEAQSKLSGALESGSFLRVGGSEAVKVNVRVVAATHEDLAQEVSRGRFREDLYYHLNVLPIRVPPLREHCEDVPELLSFYVNWYVDHEKLSYRRFSLAAQNRLRNYHWPGNIRELRNLVQRLLILGVGEEIGLDEVEAAVAASAAPAASGGGDDGLLQMPLKEARERFERTYLRRMLVECRGSVAMVAERAGVERTNLYRKLRSLQIDPKNPEAGP